MGKLALFYFDLTPEEHERWQGQPDKNYVAIAEVDFDHAFQVISYLQANTHFQMFDIVALFCALFTREEGLKH